MMEVQRPKPPAYEAFQQQQQRQQQQQHHHHHLHQLPVFPQVPTAPPQSRSTNLHTPTSGSPRDAMNIDNLVSPQSRPQRASSVTSGMSLEDMQAAETLEMLRNCTSTSPKSRVPTAPPPPHLVASQSDYPADEQEPLLYLLTSQVPLLTSAVNGSIYAYSSTKSFSPVIRYPAEFIERNIGNPVAGTIGAVGRRTGVEGGLRWALQGTKRKHSPEASSPTRKAEMDVGGALPSPATSGRRTSAGSEPLPVYDANGRSPPYQEDSRNEEERQILLQSQQDQPPPGWQTKLMVTTGGLGVAMSEQSRKNLKYCLSWLRWANDRLAYVIVSVAKVLQDLEHGPEDSEQQSAKIAARLQALSKDVADTVKKVVVEVSNYAGGALPTNARDLVHRYFNSLPHRWRYATTMADTNAENQNESESISNGKRVLALAQEGLGMMTQVTIVVNDTLVSAENWCDRLGKKNDQQDEKQLESPQDTKMEDAKDAKH